MICITILSYKKLMLTVRLPDELEKELEIVTKNRHSTKSAIIITALSEYLARFSQQKSPYEVGKHLFGKHSLGSPDLSSMTKIKYLENLRAKYNH